MNFIFCRHRMHLWKIICQCRQILLLVWGAYWSTGWLRYILFHMVLMHLFVHYSVLPCVTYKISSLLILDALSFITLITGAPQIWFNARNTLSHGHLVRSISLRGPNKEEWYAVGWSYYSFAGIKIWGFLASQGKY